MGFNPHLTVATIVEHDGRFLMVEEMQGQRLVINQPAGHLEADESLIEAAVRETLEETGWTVQPTALTGIYLFKAANGETYQRVCFTAKTVEHHPELSLDEGIVRASWLTLDELERRRNELRSYLVLDCLHDYRHKPHYPLEVIR
ncbi:NUDIX hydrolase [Halopseudomonas salegens]|uniref:Phosphatase NudJ n=1 Tax=Halopseudomonas salegens TaxID=1434072 RepID=A0A1H2F7D0_9GAMM|nr:NUDIX hydrolase [Halopseudomonas salegens]SDU02888.1 ADP-ribose pyrophosphatase YjhB, NUDIX family [Halopseudomonas salegens]